MAEIAINDGEDELDYYYSLLKAGITVDIVTKRCGFAAGWHMKNYCREHGLI